MALNTAHANGGVLIYSGERILIFYDGVEMGFEMNDSMPHFKGKKKGRAYLTTHRVIFNSRDSKDTLQSFSMPFSSMEHVELEQPIFGANYIKGVVNAQPNGNYSGAGKWKMHFNHGGAIEFGQCMLQAGRMASMFAPMNAPPPYVPPSGPYYQAPPPAYAPPEGPQYGFVPYATFPTLPPSNTVYTTNAPPPYPGIMAPDGVSVNAPQDSKAAEAAQSAYYNPANPQHVYMPEPYPQDAPPAYSELEKKKN